MFDIPSPNSNPLLKYHIEYHLASFQKPDIFLSLFTEWYLKQWSLSDCWWNLLKERLVLGDKGNSTKVWNDWCELNAMRSSKGQVWDLLIEEWKNSERSTEELLLPLLVVLTSSSTLILEGILANALTAEYVLAEESLKETTHNLFQSELFT